VRVATTCGERSPFPNPGGLDVAPTYDWITWAPDRAATGVMISEKHALTAGHVVQCPVIPGAHIFIPGRDYRHTRYRMVVDRDEIGFGDGKTDAAHLTAIGAYDRFGVHIAPPALGPDPHMGTTVCAEVLRKGGPTPVCGTMMWYGVFDATTIPGDSGAPVYDEQGRLLGLVIQSVEIAGGKFYTRYQPVDASWLEGT
jgi:hypothetical protein